MAARYLTLGALGWLTFGAVCHFLIDVVSQHLRGVREPGAARTAYYGLHSAYPLSQLLLAAMGFLIAHSAPGLLQGLGFRLICLVAAVCWLAICVLFIEYRPPLFIAVIFVALMLTAIGADALTPRVPRS